MRDQLIKFIKIKIAALLLFDLLAVVLVIVIVLCLFLAAPWVCLWSIIVTFCGHTCFSFIFHTAHVTACYYQSNALMGNYVPNLLGIYTLLFV